MSWNREPTWACLVVLAVLPPLSADDLEPAETHAVLVGVLEWKHGLSGYPKRHRKDQELRDLLVRRGTPAANVALLLDKDTTLPRIRAAVSKTARAAGWPGLPRGGIIRVCCPTNRSPPRRCPRR
jgi:hypothetical protein